MATDIAGLRAELLLQKEAAERAILELDVPAETALRDTAEAAWKAAQRQHSRAFRRWSFVQETLAEPARIQAKIDLITPE